MAKGGRAEYSVRAKGELTIGYGAGGGVPRSFYLRKNQEVDIGFLKLFISTEWVDYSRIEQGSPFEDKHTGTSPTRGKRPLEQEGNARAISKGSIEEVREEEDKEAWGTLSVPVVVRRRIAGR